MTSAQHQKFHLQESSVFSAQYLVNTQSGQLAGRSCVSNCEHEVEGMLVSYNICLEGAQMYQKSSIRLISPSAPSGRTLTSWKVKPQTQDLPSLCQKSQHTQLANLGAAQL